LLKQFREEKKGPMEIVREYNLHGYRGLERTFPEFFINESGEKISESCLKKRISRYNK